MNNIYKILGIIAIIAVIMFSMVTCNNSIDDTIPYTYNEFEWTVFELTNEERVKHGLPSLEWDNKLGAAARAHSEDMARNNYFNHTGLDGSNPGQRITRAGFSWRLCAENIARGHPTPAVVVNAWMNSQGHRNNILNANLTHLGVGHAGNRWTQKFATPR
ncbi:MAG: CAP domain-containing protein [Treponema sp.]|nr:CAP domain-containing protein [Treponema sp.]